MSCVRHAGCDVGWRHPWGNIRNSFHLTIRVTSHTSWSAKEKSVRMVGPDMLPAGHGTLLSPSPIWCSAGCQRSLSGESGEWFFWRSPGTQLARPFVFGPLQGGPSRAPSCYPWLFAVAWHSQGFLSTSDELIGGMIHLLKIKFEMVMKRMKGELPNRRGIRSNSNMYWWIWILFLTIENSYNTKKTRKTHHISSA